MKALIFIFFLFLNNFCFSQQKSESEFVRYETDEFSVLYKSEEFNLKVISEKCEDLFCTMFEITKKTEDAKPRTSIIQLKVQDCSRLGVGTHIAEKRLKDKDLNYLKITTLDNYVYYEKTSKVEKLIEVDYVCIKNNKVYTLKFIKELISEKEYYEEELTIMNTFRVK